MNNDKRIILAIALYAAVITMVLHTLSSEGHERFPTKQAAQNLNASETFAPTSSMSGIQCKESNCVDEKMVCPEGNIDLAVDIDNRNTTPDSHPASDNYRDEQRLLNDEGSPS
jgi:hypothetical protein